MTAEWTAVLGVTYATDAALLEPHLPRGAQIDELDGSPRVSLVAFRFRRTRVRGIAIPGHVNFPEINLRFYVRLHGERGVVFIREFVPRRAIAWTAQLVYNEPYRCVPMREELRRNGDLLEVSHGFGPQHSSAMLASADPASALPQPDSPEYWLTHHDLGLGRARDGRARRYRVEHPLWALHEVRDLHLDVDFAGLYGREWAYLASAEPSHVTLAAGSGVRIYPARDI